MNSNGFTSLTTGYLNAKIGALRESTSELSRGERQLDVTGGSGKGIERKLEKYVKGCNVDWLLCLSPDGIKIFTPSMFGLTGDGVVCRISGSRT
jgi:hypothetical protein